MKSLVATPAKIVILGDFFPGRMRDNPIPHFKNWQDIAVSIQQKRRGINPKVMPRR